MQQMKKGIKKVKYVIFTFYLLMCSIITKAQDLDNNAAHASATSGADAAPLYQKIYNVLSIFITIAAIYGFFTEISAIISPQEGDSTKKDQEQKGHMKMLGYIVIGILFWYFGAPFLLKKGFSA
jgi:hypothetical protein